MNMLAVNDINVEGDTNGNGPWTKHGSRPPRCTPMPLTMAVGRTGGQPASPEGSPPEQPRGQPASPEGAPPEQPLRERTFVPSLTLPKSEPPFTRELAAVDWEFNSRVCATK